MKKKILNLKFRLIIQPAYIMHKIAVYSCYYSEMLTEKTRRYLHKKGYMEVRNIKI